MPILELYLGVVGPSTFNFTTYDTTLLGVPFRPYITGDSAPIRPIDAYAGFVASSWTASGLPLGVTLVYKKGSWFFTGAPTQSGTFNIYLTVTGSNGQQSTEGPFRVYVRNHPAHVAKSQTFSGKFNESFNGALAVLDPVNAPLEGLTWEVGTGITYGPNTWINATLNSWNNFFSKWGGSRWQVALPPGLSFNEYTGAITGVPTKAGTFTCAVSLLNNSGYAAPTEYATFTVQGGAPYIPNDQFVTTKYGNYFSKTFSVLDSANRPVTSWSSPDLPPGVTLNATTGVLSGYINASNIALIQDRKRASYDPLYIGSFYVTLLAAGPGGTSSPTRIWLDVQYGTPKIIPAQIFNGTRGVAFSAAIAMDGDIYRPAYRWAATSPLPAGLILDPDSGTISGTPLNRESKTASLTATGDGGTGGTTVSFIIDAPYSAPIITAGQTFTGKVGSAFSATPAITDAIERPVTSWAGTALPSWATINATTGQITGTPSAIGAFNFELTATGPGGVSTGSISVTIGDRYSAPIITAGQTFNGKVGSAFSATPALTDSANRPATNWSATGLPSWATLNATTGAITGTPQDIAGTTITLTATGSGGTSAATTAIIGIGLGAPNILAGQTFTGKVGEAFTSPLPSLEDPLDRPASSWAITGLPVGLVFNAPSGAITGTPTTKGTITANFVASGAGGISAVTPVTFTISAGVPIIPAGQNATGKVGVPFSKKYTASDTDNRPVTSWASVSLPTWATLNSATGEVTGTPTTSGAFPISLTATGSGGTSSVAAFSIALGNGAPLIAAGQTLAGKVGEAFSSTPALTDAASRPATMWGFGGLPAGLFPNYSTGAITGTPTQSGSFSFSISALSVEGESVESVAFTIAFGSPQIIPGQKLSIVQGAPFSAQLQGADESDRPISAWTSSDIPAWATLESDGRVHGTPPASGQFTFTVTATGPGGTDTDTVSLEAPAKTPVIATTLVNVKVGVLHESYFTTTEPASMPVSFWGVTGALPAGLSLDPTTGRLFGTPQAVGTSSVSTYAQSSVGKGSATISIVVAPGVPIVSAQEFYGAAGKDFDATLQAQDTTYRPASTWSIAPALPAGLALDTSTGTITGNLTNPVRFSATLTATGAGGTASAALTLDIGAPIIAPLDAKVDFALDAVVAFTTATITSGRSKVETWTASSLPTGITFKDGVFLGRAQASGTYQITVTTQNKWDTSNAKVTFVVAQGAPIIAAGQKFSAKTDSKADFEVGLVNKSSRPATKWTAQGALPGGLGLSQDGRISGTPSQNFTGTITLIAESPLGKSSASIALTIKGPIFYGDKNPILQPGRVVKTFPSGLVMVSEVYKMRPSNEAAARSRFAQGQTLVTSSTSSTALTIFPAPDFKSQDSGFVEMVVTAYGFTGADFRRTRKRMQSAKILNQVLEVPAGGGAPTFQGKYSESNIQILANTHTITRAVAYGTGVTPIDGAHGVSSLGGYTSVISPVTERYDVTAFGEVDEVTVTTAYEVTFTQQ